MVSREFGTCIKILLFNTNRVLTYVNAALVSKLGLVKKKKKRREERSKAASFELLFKISILIDEPPGNFLVSGEGTRGRFRFSEEHALKELSHLFPHSETLGVD